MPDRATDTHWNPGQYLLYADHRLRPAVELLERVPLEAPGVIYDLGCGAGNVTKLLADRWRAARVIGVDNSPEMLEKAAALSEGIEWVEAHVEEWAPDEAPDLIYSNAALHWVDGHHELFPRLAGYLRDGGCLAVQMPLSWGLDSHVLMRETLESRPFGTEDLRNKMARKWVEVAGVYYDLLIDRAQSLDIWETEYVQELEGDDPVLEWVKGTGLRPILNGLEGEEREAFLAAYRQRLRDAYPRISNGKTLYPFRRLFMVVTV